MHAILRKWRQAPIDWHDLTTQAQLGHLQEHLQEEDEITYIDRGGIARTAVAAKVTPTGALFILKDIAFDRKMYDSLNGSLLSWEGSEEVLVTVSKFKKLDQFCFYCKATPGVKKIAGMASFTGSTPKWCPLGRDPK